MAPLTDLGWHIGRKGLSLLVPPVWSPGKISGGAVPDSDALLLESGDYLLLESGDFLLLE